MRKHSSIPAYLCSLPLLGLAQVALTSAAVPPPISTAKLTDPIDRKVCDLALTLSPDGDDGLSAYVTSHLVAPDGDQLEIVEQGTMHSQSLQITDAAGKERDLGEPVGWDDGQMDMGVRILPFMGRVYVLNYAGSTPTYLDRIERLTPDHKLTPVCLVRAHIDKLLVGQKGADFALCDRIAKGDFAVIPERKYGTPLKTYSETIAGGAQVEASINVDFRNNGKPETLQRVGDYSGAGPGCDHSVFRPVKGASSPGAQKLLRALQDEASSDGYVPGTLVHGCADEPKRWVRVGGRIYLEMRSHYYQNPVTEDSEYWLVSTVENGTARRVCEASYVHLAPTLTSIWDGKAWVPPPPKDPTSL